MSASQSLTLFVLSVLFLCVGAIKPNNVCPTFQDYASMRTNAKCWYNPDVNSSPKSISKRYGFRLENHEIITSDGYILRLYRMVSSNETVGSSPVLLQHGFCANAAFWFLHGKTSIPLYLASVGFDVWLSDARGTGESLKHVNMSSAEPDFWNFSFHEIAVFDVPAFFDYIRQKTGGKKVTFIGHSMGGTIQFVYASLFPDHAKKNVNAIIALAPVVYTKNLKSELPRFWAPHTEFLLKEFYKIDFHGGGTYPHLRGTFYKICNALPSLCHRMLEVVTGASQDNFEPERFPLVYRRFPASFSIKTLAHYGQELYAGGKFQYFDYGPRENLLRYNSVEPPRYKVEKINIPVYIFYGEADLFSVEEDNMHLFSDLKTEKYIVSFRGANNTVTFGHVDFLTSKYLADLDRYLTNVIKNITSRVDYMDTNKKR